MAEMTTPKPLAASRASMRTVNPIRMTIESMKMTPNPEKDPIPLSIGDPAVFGNMDPHPSVKQALVNSVMSGKGHGYGHSAGFLHAREAVATYLSTPTAPLTGNDIFLASGASGALELAIPVLADEGQNILIPRPGFSLYVTVCENHGIEARFYSLDAKNNWFVDLEDLERLIDENTRAILINNPSNPCGSVFSKEHLLDILKIAEKHNLPIISDEIYAHMVFPPNEYHSLASLSSSVPVLEIGGIAKRFLVPGWRLGWVAVHDRKNLFKNIREGLFRLTTIVLGPNTHVQDALIDILAHTPAEFFESTLETLRDHAQFSAEKLSAVPGLNVVAPGGAMYMMVGIDTLRLGVTDDVNFAEELMREESVFVLPAKCFGSPNFFRIVYCAPKEKLAEAFDRISQFCSRRYRESVE